MGRSLATSSTISLLVVDASKVHPERPLNRLRSACAATLQPQSPQSSAWPLAFSLVVPCCSPFIVAEKTETRSQGSIIVTITNTVLYPPPSPSSLINYIFQCCLPSSRLHPFGLAPAFDRPADFNFYTNTQTSTGIKLTTSLQGVFSLSPRHCRERSLSAVRASFL